MAGCHTPHRAPGARDVDGDVRGTVRCGAVRHHDALRATSPPLFAGRPVALPPRGATKDTASAVRRPRTPRSQPARAAACLAGQPSRGHRHGREATLQSSHRPPKNTASASGGLGRGGAGRSAGWAAGPVATPRRMPPAHRSHVDVARRGVAGPAARVLHGTAPPALRGPRASLTASTSAGPAAAPRSFRRGHATPRHATARSSRSVTSKPHGTQVGFRGDEGSRVARTDSARRRGGGVGAASNVRSYALPACQIRRLFLARPRKKIYNGTAERRGEGGGKGHCPCRPGSQAARQGRRRRAVHVCAATQGHAGQASHAGATPHTPATAGCSAQSRNGAWTRRNMGQGAECRRVGIPADIAVGRRRHPRDINITPSHASASTRRQGGTASTRGAPPAGRTQTGRALAARGSGDTGRHAAADIAHAAARRSTPAAILRVTAGGWQGASPRRGGGSRGCALQ